MDATFTGTWSYFPDVDTTTQTREGAAVSGGYLPHTEVTHLDLSLGNLVTDPTSPKFGLPQEDTGLNLLVATTFGRGAFAIRLTNEPGKATVQSGPRVVQLLNPAPSTATTSDRLQVLFSGAVDPATSEKRMVTTLRSSPAGAPCSTRRPQAGQNRAPSGISEPQLAHGAARAAPHWTQKRAPSGFGAPHAAQDFTPAV